MNSGHRHEQTGTRAEQRGRPGHVAGCSARISWDKVRLVGRLPAKGLSFKILISLCVTILLVGPNSPAISLCQAQAVLNTSFNFLSPPRLWASAKRSESVPPGTEHHHREMGHIFAKTSWHQGYQPAFGGPKPFPSFLSGPSSLSSAFSRFPTNIFCLFHCPFFRHCF